MMKHNVGGLDRTIRIIVGTVLVIIGAVFLSWWGIVGLVVLSTGLLNWCPLYLPFGISTCHEENELHHHH
jgi:type IV secretory pathway TrbD component